MNKVWILFYVFLMVQISYQSTENLESETLCGEIQNWNNDLGLKDPPIHYANVEIQQPKETLAPKFVQVCGGTGMNSVINGKYFKSTKLHNGRVYYLKRNKSQYIYWSLEQNRWHIYDSLDDDFYDAFLNKDISFPTLCKENWTIYGSNEDKNVIIKPISESTYALEDVQFYLPDQDPENMIQSRKRSSAISTFRYTIDKPMTGLTWYDDKTTDEQLNLLQGMRICRRGKNKSCKSPEMKTCMGNSPYHLDATKTEDLCRYIKLQRDEMTKNHSKTIYTQIKTFYKNFKKSCNSKYGKKDVSRLMFEEKKITKGNASDTMLTEVIKVKNNLN